MMRKCKAALVACLLAALAGSAAMEDPAPPPLRLVRAARSFVGTKYRYDGSYRVIPYPGGDPGGNLGACTDLVVRSYRALGIDLQQLVHEDIKADFEAYPARRLYNQTRPDPNIDHRRVPNLMTFFRRKGQTFSPNLDQPNLPSWQAGDLVVFDLLDNGIPSHIGVVSDRKTSAGLPLVIHHFPPYPTEEDCLGRWKIVGHFRYFPNPDSSTKK